MNPAPGLSVEEPTRVSAPWPFTQCPTCDGALFDVTTENATVIFACVNCHHRYRYSLGYLIWTDPPATPHLT